MSSADSSNRLSSYKNLGRKDENRDKRFEGSVELRKQARSEQLQKRRHVVEEDSDNDDAAGFGAEGDNVLGDLQGPKESISVANLPAIVAGIKSADPALRFQSTKQCRILLSREKNAPIAQVLETGIMPHMVQFLANEADPSLQLEACWVLTNIASGTSAQTHAVVHSGALPYFIKMLGYASEELREQACWAVGNIAGEGGQLRDLCLQYGLLAPLLLLLQPGACGLALARNATWTVSNLCRGKDPQPSFAAVAPALPTLAALLHSDDEDVITDATWALSYLTDGDNERIGAVLATGAAPRLVALAQHHKTALVTPALRTLGNMVTGSDAQTDAVLHSGLLFALPHLLQHAKEAVRKEACWTVSNVTAGNAAQIQAVLEAGLLAPLLACLSHGDTRTRKEACWALFNIASGGALEQVQWVAAQGSIKPLCDLLAVPDARLLCVALDALTFFLKAGVLPQGANPVADWVEECGGMERIETLQNHANEDIYQKAFDIIQAYFPEEDEMGSSGDMSLQMVPIQSGGFVF